MGKMDYGLRERRKMERSFEAISPFELKNELIRLANDHQKKSDRALLNAGRGNPNWIAATPREAFFALGQFAVLESRRVWDDGDLAGKPRMHGIVGRFRDFVQSHSSTPGIGLLDRVVHYGVERCGFDEDEWLYELVDGIIGDNYPTPDRMLVHMERVVHDFVQKELCGGDESLGGFDLFAVEGATAAMCYIFDSLLANHLLSRGDKVAIMVPIFPPYVEIPELRRYAFDVIEIKASGVDDHGDHTWQYPPHELNKLADPNVKALFLVNPSNPPSVAMDRQSVRHLVDTVRAHNPQLMIITDDVYSTFVEGYRSLMADLPRNTIGVYSFSKYFGVTGWRLGVIAVAHDNIFDYQLARLSHDIKRELESRYASLTRDPSKLSFIDRMVADSRQVALNHTAGLSTPQQVQMALFCAFALLDNTDGYKQLTRDICHRRMTLLYDGLDLPLPKLPNDADYYTEIDLEIWATQTYGREFTDYLKANYEPIDILFRLAENSGVVLLNGGGFHGPTWSIRVSLANLDDEAYAQIGRDLQASVQQYVQEWKGTKSP